MKYLIEEQSQLDDIESLILNSSIISVDTEFLREKTYKAKLCLVQLGIGDNQYCVDVLAIENQTVLRTMFTDTNILKIFHAARQDMEVLYQAYGVLPKPIYDTQLAVAFLGLDMQIGYGNLVEKELGVVLEKSQSRTDWTRRPLSEKQIDYAADDVTYLQPLYERSNKALEAANKQGWYAQEIETYYDISLYVIDPQTAYKRLYGGSLKPHKQHILKGLANWREGVAQKRDIPRTWVIRDNALFDIAYKEPKNMEEMRELDVFGKRAIDKFGPMVLKMMEQIKRSDGVEQKIWDKVEPLTKQQKGICSKAMKQVAVLAEQHSLAQALLSNRKTVESLYRHRQSKKLLTGWRKQVVGEPLLDFLKNLV